MLVAYRLAGRSTLGADYAGGQMARNVGRAYAMPWAAVRESPPVPIVLCKNQHDQLAVLDGRDRYDICLETRIEPQFVEWTGEPETMLVSANLHRDLSRLQRDLIAARTVTAKRGGDRILGDNRKESAISIPAKSGNGGKPNERTVEEAAAIYRRNPAGVERARAILDRGLPQLIARIDSGDYFWLSTSKAYGIVTPTGPEKAEGLTSEAKQRQWLEDHPAYKRAQAKPPLSPAERFQRNWRNLSDEDKKQFALDFAIPWLVGDAKLDGTTEIALPEARIIVL